MDEGLLNDLLECSVCLERLDTSSRVLPCQHTFCLKCLKEIVQSHNELRCPECRVAVNTRVEDLPPNVLLMRILGGMRSQRPQRNQQPTTPQHGASTRHAEPKPSPHALALYDYTAKEQGDLTFKKGDVIKLHKRVDAFWFRGEADGHVGIFPVNYVQVMAPLPSQPAYAKALYDFRMSAPDEEGCLTFDKGAVITVLRRVDENWAEGRLEERLGIFPIAFVQLDHAARLLVQARSAIVTGRAVPSVPAQTARSAHADHGQHQQHAYRHQQMSLSAQIPSQNYRQAAMSQSHPVYQPTGILLPQPVGVALQGKEQVQLNNSSVTAMRIGGYDNVRPPKYDYSTAPMHQGKRQDYVPTSNSSDSSSTPVSVSTPGPNTTSNSSSDSTEPSSPISPDNQAEAADKANETSTNVASGRTSDSTNTSLNVSLPLSMNSSKTVLNTSESGQMNTSANFRLNTSANVVLNTSSNAVLNTAYMNTSGNIRDHLNSSGGALLNISGSANTSGNAHSNLSGPAQASACKQLNDSESTRVASGSNTVSSGTISASLVQESNKAAHTTQAYRPTADVVNFSMGAAGQVPARHRDRHRDKRNSLTPATHTPAPHANTNRHSAEVCVTREPRRRRSRSGDRSLPALYVALYSYKPRKPDELELSKSGLYMVTERCQDGWYKGYENRSQRAGVFPGNYVALFRKNSKAAAQMLGLQKLPPPQNTPDAPPRTATPPSSGPHSFPWSSGTQLTQPKSAEKNKEKPTKSDKASTSLMKRLAAMKKNKSPPPGMDNPVFEDCQSADQCVTPAVSQARPHPVHVRSGSCPSQLLHTSAAAEAGLRQIATVAARGRRERAPLPAVATSTVQHVKHTHRASEEAGGSATTPAGATHRKSLSLDASRDHRKHPPPLNERFRCIAPYPPNSEYELELRAGDLVIVTRKRGDGWYKGTLERTGRTGLFPASFVKSCDTE